MKKQLLLDLDDIAELISGAEIIKETFPDGKWVVKWYLKEEDFQWKLIVKEPDEENEKD